MPASVTKLSQLQGKTVGVSVAGSATDLVTRKLLEDPGLQPGVNVQIAYIGVGAPQIAAMQNNVVGGAILPSSVYTEANQIGWHPIVNVNKSKYSGYLLSLVTANKAWVASNNKAVTNFFTAQLQARKMISNNQNLAVQAQVSVAGLTTEIATTGYQTTLPLGSINFRIVTKSDMQQLLTSIVASFASAADVKNPLGLTNQTYLKQPWPQSPDPPTSDEVGTVDYSGARPP